MIDIGKTEAQVAREINIPIEAVKKIYADEYVPKSKKRADISLREFLLLQELINKGYAFPCVHYGHREYQMLKKKFPNLFRVIMENRTIFF